MSGATKVPGNQRFNTCSQSRWVVSDLGGPWMTEQHDTLQHVQSPLAGYGMPDLFAWTV
jgi:hypothetical protein